MKNNRKQRIFFACVVIAVLMGLMILRMSRERREAGETAAPAVTEETVTSAEPECPGGAGL